MITEVPFVYSAKVVPPGKRTPRDTPVTALFAVSIRELDETRFPLAAKFSDNETDVRFPGTLHDIRTDGRYFYMPFCDPTSLHGRPMVHVRSDELVPNLAGHALPNPFRAIQKVRYGNDYRTPPVAERELEGRVEWHDRAERTALLGAAAADTVSCGGILWQRCGEPCFQVHRDGTAAAVMMDHKSLADHTGILWRADKFEECMALVNGGAPFDYVYGTLDVVLPGAFRSKMGTRAMYNAAVRGLEAAGHHLRRCSREGLMRYVDLREALEGADGDVTPELAEAVQAVVDAPSSATEGYPVAELELGRTRWRSELVGDEAVGLMAPPAPG